ncbi:MAG TPA: FAD/NAD(P)-binding protein [Solirubrobacteraceae bacterium]|nr:FAD/NAD(P)-binding protein [Solirubrobacteraceae bacterium]
MPGASDASAAFADPGPMVPAPFAVSARRRETADTWTLELAPRAGGRLEFEPGQFTMLSAFGAGEVPISISGDPDGEGPLVHTVRAVGLATEAICRAVPGEVLGVRGPFGRPWPVAEVEGADVLVVAGGIGLAPLRPAILALLARRERYGRLLLLYGGRSPELLLYGGELREWAERGLEVALTVDSAGPEWLGQVGVVPRLVRRARFDAANAVALVCGPEVMMRFAAGALAQSGVGSDRVYASMERNMQCGIGHCGHCQLGPTLICRDGPVYRWSELERWLAIREL